MPRFRLTLEYDGTPFQGWQAQGVGLTVQQVLAEAVFALSGERVTVAGAGRTDAGVHATGQVAHVDLTRAWRTDTLRDALNAHVRPHPVAVLAAAQVPDEFDARRSAVRRHYLYRIANRRPDLTLDRLRAWRVPRPLDLAAMREGAARLIGRHDFTTFRASECQAKSPIRTLDQLDVTEVGAEVHVIVSARSFLHNQVRSMVGTLVEVGDHRLTPDAVTAALEARDRRRCGQVAPPHALYLTQVDYPDPFR